MNFIKNILPVIVWIFSLFLTFLFFPSILAVLLSLIFPAFILIKWLGGTSDRIDSSSTSKSFDDFIDSKFQSEIPRSEPDIQYIDNLISKYELKALQGFPKSLFIPANYNGWNFLVTLFLLLSTTYFLTGFAGFIFIHNNWLQNQSSGFIPLVWNLIFGDGASSKISTTVDLFFRFLVFICNYCLAWIVFDPKEAEGYAMGFFNGLIGIIYMFAPLDLIPDVIPVVGSLDDTFLGAGMILLGASSWFRAKSRDTNTETVLQLINDGNSGKAIQLLLKDKGIAVLKKSNRSTGK